MRLDAIIWNYIYIYIWNCMELYGIRWVVHHGDKHQIYLGFLWDYLG